MRVAMLSVHSSPLGPLGSKNDGGMSVYLREICRHVANMGVEVDIFSRLDDPDEPRVTCISPSVRLVRIPAGPAIPLDKNRHLEILMKFVQGVERFQRNEARAYALIHAHYWISGLAGIKLRSLWNVPLVTTFHTLGAIKQRWPDADCETPERLEAEALLARSSDRVLVTTEQERADVVALFGVTRDRISIVPGGVDLAHFHIERRSSARAALDLPQSGRLAFAVGRFVAVKGFPLLLDAFAQQWVNDNQFLIIAGENDSTVRLVKDLQRVAEQKGVARHVSLPGRIEHEQLPQWYNAADCVVVPSYYESFGLVALESLACGTPVISARTGGMADYVRHGSNGMLFDPGCSEQLASCLSAMAEQHYCRTELRGSVVSYAWSNGARRLAAAYSALLDMTRNGRQDSRIDVGTPKRQIRGVDFTRGQT